jgi:hypothetical protein
VSGEFGKREGRAFVLVLGSSIGLDLVVAAWAFAWWFAPPWSAPALIVLAVCASGSGWASQRERHHVDTLLSAASALEQGLVERHGPFLVFGLFEKYSAIEALANDPAVRAHSSTSMDAAWVRGATRARRIELIVNLVAVIVSLIVLIWWWLSA